MSAAPRWSPPEPSRALLAPLQCQRRVFAGQGCSVIPDQGGGSSQSHTHTHTPPQGIRAQSLPVDSAAGEAEAALHTSCARKVALWVVGKDHPWAVSPEGPRASCPQQPRTAGMTIPRSLRDKAALQAAGKGGWGAQHHPSLTCLPAAEKYPV